MGAETLVRLVDEALDVTSEDVLLDAYAGGGLFSLTVGRRADRVLAVESARLAAEDLRYNSKEAGVDVRLVPKVVERGVRNGDWSVVVCDPPRVGLGAEGVAALTQSGPRAVAYVSCDPASLARDARLLFEAGYRLEYATPVDMFPQTFHIETVARFELR
jgi:23S rRNA (uracil1939-C5)-methyltransferase